MSTLSYIKHLGWAAFVLLGAASCDSLIYDREGDCSVHYRLRFRYDMNLKFADAFAHEVEAVRLYAFDSEGKLVWQAAEQGEALAADGYSMLLDLAPGSYRLVAWCGLDGGDSFSLPDAASACSPDELHLRDGGGRLLVPDLFRQRPEAAVPRHDGGRTAGRRRRRRIHL